MSVPSATTRLTAGAAVNGTVTAVTGWAATATSGSIAAIRIQRRRTARLEWSFIFGVPRLFHTVLVSAEAKMRLRFGSRTLPQCEARGAS